MDVLGNNFAKLKEPILNKVADMGYTTELYHNEITRTQTINRDMLAGFKKTLNEFEDEALLS